MYEYDKGFKLLQSRVLKEADSFLHDFVVTDNYYVFFSVSWVWRGSQLLCPTVLCFARLCKSFYACICLFYVSTCCCTAAAYVGFPFCKLIWRVFSMLQWTQACFQPPPPTIAYSFMRRFRLPYIAPPCTSLFSPKFLLLPPPPPFFLRHLWALVGPLSSSFSSPAPRWFKSTQVGARAENDGVGAEVGGRQQARQVCRDPAGPLEGD